MADPGPKYPANARVMVAGSSQRRIVQRRAAGRSATTTVIDARPGKALPVAFALGKAAAVVVGVEEQLRHLCWRRLASSAT